VNDFLGVFEATKNAIAGFEGCHGLSLLQDANDKHVFFTYSLWESELHLNKYRFSELFKSTWAQTKILFNDKPHAWSTIVYEKVK
jgi:heme-degrading monooxygenase HmoA